MKAAIHPAYNEIRVMCACGNSFSTRSTHKGDIHVEICSSCHPFFTGKQKLMDTAGRVERFRRKYARRKLQRHKFACESHEVKEPPFAEALLFTPKLIGDDGRPGCSRLWSFREAKRRGLCLGSGGRYR